MGKSALASELALKFNGEIVNGDSRQVYRYMNIGTSKPSIQDKAKATHHMFDIVAPDEPFSLALYLQQARETIENIHSRSRIPILVGGTGQYIWGIIDGFVVPAVSPNNMLRLRMEDESKLIGHQALWERLRSVDPISADRIHPNNHRRVVRALEVYLETGIPFSQVSYKKGSMYRTLIIGITAARNDLYRIIDNRVENMVENGWKQEVKSLLGMGYSVDLPAMSSLGYRELIENLNGNMSMPQSIMRIKSETHRFARNQYSWFKISSPRIHWFDNGKVDLLGEIKESVDYHLSGTGSLC